MPLLISDLGIIPNLEAIVIKFYLKKQKKKLAKRVEDDDGPKKPRGVNLLTPLEAKIHFMAGNILKIPSFILENPTKIERP